MKIKHSKSGAISITATNKKDSARLTSIVTAIAEGARKSQQIPAPKRKIYVASSWRNPYQPRVVELLRQLGHEVYDFRNPTPHTGFSWSEIDENWEQWTTDEYLEALKHPTAERGFNSDFDAMKWADTCVMVLPCGRSANTEAGWMKGVGKNVFVYQPIPQEPELMYKIYDAIWVGEHDIINHFN